MLILPGLASFNVGTVPLKIVNKNNGEMPCQHYCVGVSGGPWNGELSVAWDGASCTATSDPSISCYDYPGKPVKCTCGPTGAGWNMAPFDSAGTYVRVACMRLSI